MLAASPPANPPKIDRALDQGARAFRRSLMDLVELLKFRTISSDPDCRPAMAACASWLARYLSDMGLQARVFETAGAPIVMASWEGAAGRPTLLIYGHYDVQPTGPEKEWSQPPFEPRIRNGSLYARGASDDKGQLFAQVCALEAHLRATGRLPLNVRCLFDGEEEIGSPSLRTWAGARAGRLEADLAVVSDSTILGPGQPAITVGLRGHLAVQLELQGAARDLHSGLFGGAVRNPVAALCRLLAGLETEDGRVSVNGFYRSVRTVSEQERRQMRRSGGRDRDILASSGAKDLAGELGYSAYERVALRPALTINGISGGHVGLGPKSVIPSRASAKLSFRLVPDQDPLEVEGLLRAHCERSLPADVTWTLRRQKAEWPVLTSTRRPVFGAAVEAYRRGFGLKPALVRSGGSISVASLLEKRLGIPTVLMGYGLPTDRQHGPDEHMRLRSLQQAIATSIHFLALAADT